MFYPYNKVVKQVCNDMRVRKWCQIFHFWEIYQTKCPECYTRCFTNFSCQERFMNSKQGFLISYSSINVFQRDCPDNASQRRAHYNYPEGGPQFRQRHSIYHSWEISRWPSHSKFAISQCLRSHPPPRAAYTLGGIYGSDSFSCTRWEMGTVSVAGQWYKIRRTCKNVGQKLFGPGQKEGMEWGERGTAYFPLYGRRILITGLQHELTLFPLYPTKPFHAL